ncbi:hypothetical protein D3C71_959390 [compost metagenome]
MRTDFKRAFQGGIEVVALHVVARNARNLDRATEPGGDLITDRVVVALAADVDRVGRLRGGGQRVAGDLALGITLGVHHRRLEGDVVVDLEAAGGEDRLGLGLLGQHHLLGGVETVVDRHGVVVVRQIARIGADALTVIGAGVIQDVGFAVVVETAPRTGRAQRVQRVCRAVGGAGQRTILRPHRLLLGVAGAEQDRGTLTGGAEGEGVGFLLTVATAVLADQAADFRAFEVGAQDDVDHAGDGVGAVDRRGAILQHFDALDQRGRDGGHVGEAGQARGPTLAVDQHQGALLAQVVQVDVLATLFRVGGQHGGLAEGLGAGDGQVLQDVADADQAGLLDLLGGHREDRLGGFDVDRADARTGDLDAIQVGCTCRFLGLGGAACGGARDQRDDHRVAQLVGLKVHCSLSPRESWVFTGVFACSGAKEAAPTTTRLTR